MLIIQNIKISIKLKNLFFTLLFVLIGFASQLTYSQTQQFKVVLDAGHGGKDPGTLGRASYKNKYESKIALNVVLQVGKLLANNADFKTIYTRKKDIFIPLHKRGNIANKADADLFISIHCNAAKSDAYGTTTYVLGMGKSAKNLELSKRENDVILLEDDYEKHYDYDPNSEEFMIGLTLMQEDYQDKSIEFAQIVQNKFSSVSKRKNRGVNQGNLAVLYDSYMPSVLIEIGFLSNKNEEKFLHTKSGIQKISKAIYEAIKKYKKRLDHNSISLTTNDQTTNITTKVNTNQNSSLNSHYYTIQFASSKKKIETHSKNFKKLTGVVREKSGSIYKYYFSKNNDLVTAKKVREKVIKLGYKDAFIKRVKNKNTVNNTDTKPNNIIANKKKTTTNNTVTNNNSANFHYTIQIASNPKKIELRPYNFKGLKNVFIKKSGKIYKYYFGNTTDLDEAKKIRKKVVTLGYKDAFVTKTTAKTTIENIPKKPTISKDIVFKVQISSGRKKITTKAYNFGGLKNIERVKIGDFYKYYYGNTNNYNNIVKSHKKAIKKGYKDAKIVAVQNNRLVSLKNIKGLQ